MLEAAGVVDNNTGELLIDAGVLVGALVSLMKSKLGDVNRFKSSGDRLIADREAIRQGSTETHNGTEPDD